MKNHKRIGIFRGSKSVTRTKPIGLIWALGLMASLAATVGAQVPPPPGVAIPPPGVAIPPPGAVNPAALPALAQGTVLDARKLVDMVRLELDMTPAEQQVGMQASALLGAADGLNRAINGRVAPPQLYASLGVLEQAHQATTAALAVPMVAVEAPGSVRMNQRIGARIAQLRANFPAPMPGPPPEVLLHRVLKRELTGLISEVDLFVGSLNPKVPEGPQLMAEALALQNALRAVRHDFSRPRPEPILVTDFNAAIQTHRRLSARVERLNKGRVGPNVARVRNIGATLARIQQAVPGL